MALPSKVKDLPYIDERKNPSLQQCRLPKLFNDRNLKCLGKGEEIGVITLHVLSVGSYAYKQARHAKKDFLSKHAKFTPFWDLMQSQVSHINEPNMLTISTSNTCPNIHETMIYYNPKIKE